MTNIKRKRGRKPRAKPLTRKRFDEMRRNDDVRAVINGTMTHADFAKKWK
jgi:hypothetical protein